MASAPPIPSSRIALWPLGATVGHPAADSRRLARSAARAGPYISKRLRTTTPRAHTQLKGSARAGYGQGWEGGLAPTQLAQAKKSKSNLATSKVPVRKTKIISARASASKKSSSTCEGGG